MKTENPYQKFGRTVIDTDLPRTFRITVADYKHAKCSDHQECVLARAFKRATKADWVDVGPGTVFIGYGDKKAKRYRLNSTAKDQLRYFDTKGAFAPCTVTLMPSNVVVGTRRSYKRRSGPSGKRKPHNKPTR